MSFLGGVASLNGISGLVKDLLASQESVVPRVHTLGRTQVDDLIWLAYVIISASRASTALPSCVWI